MVITHVTNAPELSSLCSSQHSASSLSNVWWLPHMTGKWHATVCDVNQISCTKVFYLNRHENTVLPCKNGSHSDINTNSAVLDTIQKLLHVTVHPQLANCIMSCSKTMTMCVDSSSHGKDDGSSWCCLLAGDQGGHCFWVASQATVLSLEPPEMIAVTASRWWFPMLNCSLATKNVT